MMLPLSLRAFKAFFMTLIRTGTSIDPYFCCQILTIYVSPANAEAAQLYRENLKEYVRRVKATVEESWLDDDDMQAVVVEGQGSSTDP